jgi:hypothetical protein
VKLQLCQKSEGKVIEKAEYIYKEWNAITGRKKYFYVCKGWLDANSISVNSVDVSPISKPSTGYVCHYKFEC